ncbi:MAG: glycosyltransferase family 4 protein [Candidatus Rokubacteria bacterium]|nr:glycosyltransferase family 4 protein [Candidatus Rokubacteria bacterium]
MAKLRLLMVADVSPLEPHGGGSRVLREQSRRLAARGHEVTVLSRQPEATVPADSDVAGVRIRHYDVSRAHATAFFWSSIAGARRAYRDALAGRPWDRIILHQPLSAVGVRRLLPRMAPRIYLFHSPASLEYRLRAEHPSARWRLLAAPLAAALLRLTEAIALRGADRVVVLSEYMRRELAAVHSRGTPPVVVIPGGVDLGHFRPAEDRMAVRRALGLPADRFLLLTVRDLHPRMGLEALVEAVGALHDALPLMLVVGGQGPLRADLEAQVGRMGLAGHVRFAGHIAEAELPRYYQAADCFVLPTRALEGFGLVTVEALACGTPVLGTPVGATPEILAPLAPELLSDDTSAEALAAGLRRVAPLGRDAAFRVRCRAYAESRYDWETAVDRLEDLLMGLAPG